MADAPIRRTTSETKTTVRYFARPTGRERDNPPNLGHLRAFLDSCDGLPDDIHVHINPRKLDEGGRLDVEFSLSYRHPDPNAVAAADVEGRPS